MASKFKTGDKVRFKDEAIHLDYKAKYDFLGKVFYVTNAERCDAYKHQTEGLLIGITSDEMGGKDKGVFEYRLELVRSFKAGDEVQVVKDSWKKGLTEAVGKIVKVKRDGLLVRFEGWGEGHGIESNEWFFSFSADEVVPYVRSITKPDHFNIGDRVRLISNWPCIPIGTIGTVMEANSHMPWVEFVGFDNGCDGIYNDQRCSNQFGISEECLQLVTTNPFKGRRSCG